MAKTLLSPSPCQNSVGVSLTTPSHSTACLIPSMGLLPLTTNISALRGGISLIAFSFSGSTLIPFLVKTLPKNFISVTPKAHLSLFRVMPYDNTVANLDSCSSFPTTNISSIIQSTPVSPSSILFISFGKNSGAAKIPKGIFLYWYLPNLCDKSSEPSRLLSQINLPKP